MIINTKNSERQHFHQSHLPMYIHCFVFVLFFNAVFAPVVHLALTLLDVHALVTKFVFIKPLDTTSYVTYTETCVCKLCPYTFTLHSYSTLFLKCCTYSLLYIPNIFFYFLKFIVLQHFCKNKLLSASIQIFILKATITHFRLCSDKHGRFATPR